MTPSPRRPSGPAGDAPDAAAGGAGARRVRASRISRARIVEQLRLASRKGDRTALTLAVEEMRTLAMSPRYWERYLELLEHPLARLVDLLALKQGERIARQKGWTRPRRERKPKPAPPAPAAARRRAKRPAPAEQPSLF